MRPAGADWPQAWLDQLAVSLESLGRAAPEFLVADPAARLDDTRGLQVIQVDQDSRCQTVEVACAIRLVSQDPGQAQGLATDVDAVADLQLQCRQQTRLDPGFANLGPATGLFGEHRDLLRS